nr:hypothetical protein [Sphingomonas sp.]
MRIPLSRRLFLVGAGAFAVSCATGRSHAAPARLLFVCQFGSVKSAVAREWLRRRAAERHMPLTVESRGLTPEAHVSPALAAALKADGINSAADPLRQFAIRDAAAVDIVILFDKAPAVAALGKSRDWSDLGSMNADYPAARADLLQRIDRLLDEIGKR